VPLSTDQIRQHLERLTYKPGWSFRVYTGRFEGQHVTIETTVPNTYHEGKTVTLRIESALPPMRDTQALEDWLAWRVIRIESHEAREFLRKDGLPIYDPHAPFADRDQPAYGEQS
jgi:hypothetical protein